jgi:HEAT repeat protein
VSCSASAAARADKRHCSTTSFKLGVAISALDALGESRAAEGFAVFEKALKAKEWPIRVAAVQGLGEARTPEALEALKALVADKDDDVAASAKVALQRIAKATPLSNRVVE